MLTKQDYESEYRNHQDMRENVKKDPNRLHYHIVPPTGWLNDPNGLCQINGVNHIYFQYTPYSTGWGTKIWGHYTTKDWITFQEEEPFLFPDQKEDRHGVYSGSAFIKDGRIHYFYTGNVNLEGQQYNNVTNGREQNTIHFTSQDGMNHSKKQLVMTNEDYPEDMTKHVRDPKIFEYNGQMYMIMGARNLDDEGCALLFKSKDLENWQYYSRIESDQLNGFMWECPDLFELEGQNFLVISTQGGTTDENRYDDIFHNGYYPVQMDIENKEFQLGQFQYLDYGSDFYAAQSFEDEKGRRIILGWMGVPLADFNNDATVAYDWIHAMSLPRELKMKDGALIQQPIEEIHQLRLDHQQALIQQQSSFKTNDHCFQWDIQFEQSASDFVCQLREDVFLKYQDGNVLLELNESGAKRETKSMPVEDLKDISIYSDTSSLEIFVNQGMKVMTSRVYSKHDPYSVSIQTQSNGKMDFYPMGKYEFLFKGTE